MTVSQRVGSRPATVVDSSWRENASCRYVAPELFFPAGTTGIAIEEIEAAKAVCESCSVRGACLQFALESNQEAGIWGGTTEDERRRLRRIWLANRRRQAEVNI